MENTQTNEKIIGIPRAMSFYNNYPFYFGFFTDLGIKIVLSDMTTKQTMSQGSALVVTETCLPIKVYIGHILNLLEKGVDKKVLDAVYTPIGLDIGAQTPAEIGVAIIGEIIEVKNRKKRTYGYSKEIMRALITQEPYLERKVMATIVTRHGSAPQGLGTKMLIYRDGRCVGTIGGGCMEARVIQIARLMAAGENEQARICHVDMTGNEAEEEGMVCGGEVDVFLEVIEA